MNHNFIRVFRLYNIIFIFLCFCSCASKKELVPFDSTFSHQNIEMNISSDGSNNLTVSVATNDPIKLRTFIMQGFSLSLTEDNGDVFKFLIPSAKDVEDKIQHHPGEVKATLDGDKEKRPDIRPVIDALNGYNIKVYKNDIPIGFPKSFEVKIEPTTGCLSYEILTDKKWKISLPFSISLSSTPPLLTSDEYRHQDNNLNEATRQQPFGIGHPSETNNLQKQITISYNLSESNVKLKK